VRGPRFYAETGTLFFYDRLSLLTRKVYKIVTHYIKSPAITI
jgi:hypothetical protein